MKLFKSKWILVFFMLWLPVQGAAAAALSVCVQEDFDRHHDKTMITDNHHHDDCHKQMAENTTDHLLASLPCDDTSCDAYSNTPILADYSTPMPTNDTSVITPLNPGFTSFVPEQPQRPPLSAFL